MNNKKKLLKIILFIAIPIVLIICAIGGFLLWYFSPVNRVDRAFEARDYQTVTALYCKLNDEQCDNVQNRLYDIAKEYHDDYIKDKVKYDEVIDYYELVMSKALYNHRKTKKLYEEISVVYQSREDYDLGVDYMESGEYLEAIDFFEKVSEIDEQYYSLATENAEACKEKYVSELFDEVDLLIDSEEYEKAQEMILDALELFPENERIAAKLEEIAALLYSDIEGTWTATYDFGNLIAAEMEISGYKIYFPAELVYVFDGSNMKMYVNEDSIRPALEAMTADEESMEALYSIAEDFGVSKLEADMLVRIVYGGSYAEFIMDQYGDQISDALKSFSCEMAYTADSKKIHLGNSTDSSDNYYNYSSDMGSNMELTSYVGTQNPLNVLNYPIKLARKLR